MSSATNPDRGPARGRQSRADYGERGAPCPVDKGPIPAPPLARRSATQRAPIRRAKRLIRINLPIERNKGGGRAGRRPLQRERTRRLPLSGDLTTGRTDRAAQSAAQTRRTVRHLLVALESSPHIPQAHTTFRVNALPQHNILTPHPGAGTFSTRSDVRDRTGAAEAAVPPGGRCGHVRRQVHCVSFS